MTSAPLILAISDATGETAQAMARAGLAQFGHYDDSAVHLIPHVRTEEGLEKVVRKAASLDAVLVYTLVGPELRARIKDLVEEHGVRSVDLLGPLIARLARHLNRRPLSVPGLGHELDEDYFRRVEAVEFAVNNDDGRHPTNLQKAEIVLVGISRTSKTPLSNYIAHRGYKVANVPIVLGVPLPPELEDVDPRRVFGLAIEPQVLMKIRRERMESLKMSPDADYGDIRHIRREAEWARRIFRSHPDWTVINITRKAVEETASTILEVYRRYFEEDPMAAVRARAREARPTGGTKQSKGKPSPKAKTKGKSKPASKSKKKATRSRRRKS